MKIRRFSISGICVLVYASNLRDILLPSRHRIFLRGRRQVKFRQSPVGKMGLYISNSVTSDRQPQDHSPLPSSSHSSFRRYTAPLSEFEPPTAGITGKEAKRVEQLVE